MSLEDRATITAQKVEGNVEDAPGALAIHYEAQFQFKAKQSEGDLCNTIEDSNDDVKKVVD